MKTLFTWVVLFGFAYIGFGLFNEHSRQIKLQELAKNVINLSGYSCNVVTYFHRDPYDEVRIECDHRLVYILNMDTKKVRTVI